MESAAKRLRRDDVVVFLEEQLWNHHNVICPEAMVSMRDFVEGHPDAATTREHLDNALAEVRQDWQKLATHCGPLLRPGGAAAITLLEKLQSIRAWQSGALYVFVRCVQQDLRGMFKIDAIPAAGKTFAAILSGLVL
jgi:hypothetical protein